MEQFKTVNNIEKQQNSKLKIPGWFTGGVIIGLVGVSTALSTPSIAAHDSKVDNLKQPQVEGVNGDITTETIERVQGSMTTTRENNGIYGDVNIVDYNESGADDSLVDIRSNIPSVQETAEAINYINPDNFNFVQQVQSQTPLSDRSQITEQPNTDKLLSKASKVVSDVTDGLTNIGSQVSERVNKFVEDHDLGEKFNNLTKNLNLPKWLGGRSAELNISLNESLIPEVETQFPDTSSLNNLQTVDSQSKKLNDEEIGLTKRLIRYRKAAIEEKTQTMQTYQSTYNNLEKGSEFEIAIAIQINRLNSEIKSLQKEVEKLENSIS